MPVCPACRVDVQCRAAAANPYVPNGASAAERPGNPKHSRLRELRHFGLLGCQTWRASFS